MLKKTKNTVLFTILLSGILFFNNKIRSEIPEIHFIEGKNFLTSNPALEKENLKILPGEKGLVVVFLSARCPCSNSHNKELNELSSQFKSFNFVAIHSNSDEDETKDPAIREYFKKSNFAFPIINDRIENQLLADKLKANKTPHSFIFDKTGKKVFEGGVSDSNNLNNATRKYLREALEDIQNDKPIRTREARTLGCVIQRKKGAVDVWKK